MLSITAFWPAAMDHGAVGTYALSTRWYGVTLYGQERHRCIAMEAMHGNRAAQALEFEVVQLVMEGRQPPASIPFSDPARLDRDGRTD